MVPVFAAALFIAGCAKTLPPVEPVAPPTPPAAAAEQKEESAQDEAKKVIVAKVNDAALNMDQLIKMMNRFPPKGEGPEALEEHKKQSLDRLILQELACQQARAQGLAIGSDKSDMAINNLKENVGGEQEYAEYLKQNDFTEEDLRRQVERSLLIELIYAKEVLEKAAIPEEEVRKEYEKEKHRYILPEKVSVIDVFILKNEGKISQKKARELLKNIKADPRQDPWSLVLDGSFIVRNLVIDKDKEKELYNAAKKLKPQQLSGVIKTPNGLHIVKLKEYSPERQLTFEETKNKLEMKFKVAAQEKRMREWEQEMRKDAKIELLLDKAEQNEQAKPEHGQAGQK
jgi:parvulin-like peptidyl-prolyl isomerase